MIVSGDASGPGGSGPREDEASGVDLSVDLGLGGGVRLRCADVERLFDDDPGEPGIGIATGILLRNPDELVETVRRIRLLFVGRTGGGIADEEAPEVEGRSGRPDPRT